MREKNTGQYVHNVYLNCAQTRNHVNYSQMLSDYAQAQPHEDGDAGNLWRDGLDFFLSFFFVFFFFFTPKREIGVEETGAAGKDVKRSGQCPNIAILQQ